MKISLASIIKTEKRKIKNNVFTFFKNDFVAFQNRLLKLYVIVSKRRLDEKKVEEEFVGIINNFIKKLELFEKSLQRKNVISKVKRIFGDLVLDLSKGSILFKNSYLKPRGYPGDYKIMEAFYDNKPLSNGIAALWDRYILNDHYVIAVRNRKDSAKQMLCSLISKAYSKKIKILNLGCGSCRELRELFNENLFIDKFLDVTLIDQDKKALDYAKEKLKIIPSNIKCNFVQKTIYSLLYRTSLEFKQMLSAQDLVYSIGLADYLPDIILGKMMEFAFDLLNPHGKIVIAHKNAKRFRYPASDWFCDWHFIARNKREVLSLVKRYLKGRKFSISLNEDSTKRVFFVTIRKNIR